MDTDDPRSARIAEVGKQEKKQQHQIRREKRKKKQNERSRRAPHQGIAYAMPNTTAPERKEQRKSETGRNNTANKMQKTTQQK